MSSTNRSSKKSHVRAEKPGQDRKKWPQGRQVTFYAKAEDEVAGKTFAIYKFPKPWGRRGTLQLALEEAINPKLLCSHLISRNWIGAHDPVARDALAESVALMRPREDWLCSATLGWREDEKAFVFQDRVVGKQRKGMKIKPPIWLNQKLQLKPGRSGDLQGWIGKIARPCQRSTRLMTVLSAAFAAPLLKPMGMASFGINLHGRSKSGKSTALLVVGSVIGLGEESQLPNFNSTDASLFELGRLCNDGPMPLNEAGLIDGQKRDTYATYQRLIYGLSEGKDRARHSASFYSADTGTTAFRIIYLPNSEHPISEFARRAGRIRDHGEYARCWDVPAVSQNCKTVFDLGPDGRFSKISTRQARECLYQIRGAVKQHHGFAMEAFILYLLKNSDTFRVRIHSNIKKFLKHINFISNDGEMQHAARNFALVYAAGRMAISAKVLPWSKRVLLAAIVSCFRDGYNLISKDESRDVVVRRILLEKLRQNKIPIRGERGFDPKTTVGFTQKYQGRNLLTIRSRSFRSWFPDNAALLACLNMLENKKLLKLNRYGCKSDCRSGYEWAVTTPRWMGAYKAKSIVFYEPL